MAAWGNHYEALTVVEESGLTVIQVARPARGCLSWVAIADGDAASFASYITASLPDFPPHYVEIKRVNMGLVEAAEDRASELELGKNVCALANEGGGV